MEIRAATWGAGLLEKRSFLSLACPSVGSKPSKCHARKEQEEDVKTSREVWTCFPLSQKKVAVLCSSALTEAVLAPDSLISVG